MQVHDLKKYVLLAAAGRGERLQSTRGDGTLPKQFMDVAGQPLLAHTLLRIHEALPDVSCVVLLPKAHMAYWHTYCQAHSQLPVHTCIAGGATRFASVRAGVSYLSTLTQEGLVTIHDAVRPLIHKKTWQRNYTLAAKKGSAVCVLPITSSMREYVHTGSVHRDRSRYCTVQTPQTFRLSWLQAAFKQKEQPHFTDEATLLEEAGYPIHLMVGDTHNLKITYAEDLDWFRWQLQKST